MIRPPPRSTRTDTLFPYTTLFRSAAVHAVVADAAVEGVVSGPAAEDHRIACPGIVQDGEPGALIREGDLEIEAVGDAQEGIGEVVANRQAYRGREEPEKVDRKHVVKGKRVAVRVDPGGSRIIKNKTQKHRNEKKDHTANEQ